jgi:hypothetical protein
LFKYPGNKMPVVVSIDIGIKNLAICIYDNTIQDVLFWDNIAVETDCWGTVKKNSDLRGITLGVIDTLEKVFWDYINASFDCIQIELQPSVNPKMVFVSHVVYSKMTELFSTTQVSFVRASLKLKDADTSLLAGCKIKSAYGKRKWLSKVIVEQLVNKSAGLAKSIWEINSKAKNKTDDLADTFLMCMKYFKKI